MTEPSDLPGEVLPRLARAAIAGRLGPGEPWPREDLDPRLLEPGACFVTLNHEGVLRGCVGSLEVRRPLVDDVEANACAAAFEDPRFPPLGRGELAGIRVEVSVLGPLTEIRASCEDELVRQLVPGEDGLVLVVGDGDGDSDRRATFLPQVWASLGTPRVFVDHLRRKAGLGRDFWNLEPRFLRYRVSKWSEE